MMVRAFHEMTTQQGASTPFFHEDRDLGGDGLALGATSHQQGKRVFTNECLDRLTVSLLVIWEIIHRLTSVFRLRGFAPAPTAERIAVQPQYAAQRVERAT